MMGWSTNMLTDRHRTVTIIDFNKEIRAISMKDENNKVCYRSITIVWRQESEQIINVQSHQEAHIKHMMTPAQQMENTQELLHILLQRP